MPHIHNVSINDFLLYVQINHRGRGNSAGSEGVSVKPAASDQNVLGLYSRFVSGVLHCLGLELARIWQVLPGQSLPSSSHILETITATQQTSVSSLTVRQSTCDFGEFCFAPKLQNSSSILGSAPLQLFLYTKHLSAADQASPSLWYLMAWNKAASSTYCLTMVMIGHHQVQCLLESFYQLSQDTANCGFLFQHWFY